MENELKKRILSSIILFPIIFFLVIKGSYYFLLLLIISFAISSYEWHLLAKKKPYYILGFIFLICSFISIYQIRIGQNNSYEEFIIILFICIFTDIGGYIFGKILKGPKLTRISPKKTYAGVFGGFFLPVIAALISSLNFSSVKSLLLCMKPNPYSSQMSKTCSISASSLISIGSKILPRQVAFFALLFKRCAPCNFGSDFDTLIRFCGFVLT